MRVKITIYIIIVLIGLLLGIHRIYIDKYVIGILWISFSLLYLYAAIRIIKDELTK